MIILFYFVVVVGKLRWVKKENKFWNERKLTLEVGQRLLESAVGKSLRCRQFTRLCFGFLRRGWEGEPLLLAYWLACTYRGRGDKNGNDKSLSSAVRYRAPHSIPTQLTPILHHFTFSPVSSSLLPLLLPEKPLPSMHFTTGTTAWRLCTCPWWKTTVSVVYLA